MWKNSTTLLTLPETPPAYSTFQIGLRRGPSKPRECFEWQMLEAKWPHNLPQSFFRRTISKSCSSGLIRAKLVVTGKIPRMKNEKVEYEKITVLMTPRVILGACSNRNYQIVTHCHGKKLTFSGRCSHVGLLLLLRRNCSPAANNFSPKPRSWQN